MTQIKQKTVNGVLVVLKRYSSDYPNQKYEYHVVANGKQVGTITATKDDGMELFRKIVEKARRGGERAAWGRGGFDETTGARSAYSSGGAAFPSGGRGGGIALEDALYSDDERLPLFDEINELRGNPRDEDPY